MHPDYQNFDSLRRLLKLKHHEIPPPGYFDRFSRDVMARIKAGDTGVSFELPLWERFFGMFDVKPVFAGAFGMAVCTLLISGVLVTDRQPASTEGPAVPAGSLPLANSGAIVLPAAPSTYLVDQFVDQSPTNGVMSLFDRIAQPQATPAVQRYWVPNRN